MDELNEGGAKGRKSGLSGTAVVGLIVIVILAAVGVFILWYNAQPHPTPIKAILDDVRTYDERAVTVVGTVGSTFNIFGVKVYEVKDATGAIKVITWKGLPKSGAPIVVRAIVKEKYRLGEMSLTVLIEPRGEIK
jgi:hypothetical protein